MRCDTQEQRTIRVLSHVGLGRLMIGSWFSEWPGFHGAISRPPCEIAANGDMTRTEGPVCSVVSGAPIPPGARSRANRPCGVDPTTTARSSLDKPVILLPWRRKSWEGTPECGADLGEAHRRMSPCRGFASSIMSASLSEISTR